MKVKRICPIPVILAALGLSCGKAVPLSYESTRGSALSETNDGSSVDGTDIGNLYPVTTVIAATSGNPYSQLSDLPFTGTPVALGQAVTDGQTPFSFNFAYPLNNYKLSDAHLVIDTSRDSTDTEGIFVDGVLSGRPPTNEVRGEGTNPASPQLLSPIYAGNSFGLTPNTSYIDWAIAHYKQSTRNTFDLKIESLLPSTVRVVDLVKDGFLPVVTGDDSPVYQAYLVIQGYTLSKTPLQCTNSPTFTFQNVFLHNDGNSIGAAAFNGLVQTPFSSWGVAGTQSVEWYYDAQLPRVTPANITLTAASIALSVRRTSASPAAVVINGVGVSDPSFDRAQATGGVESWLTGSGASYWTNTFLAGIPADGAIRPVELDLLQLLGADRLRTLLVQGKLNIAVAGGLSQVQASAASSARGFHAPVSGPELKLQGTYFTEVCAIPDDPHSPLSDDNALPADAGDHASPIVSSVQVGSITSSSATIIWMTNEGATSQVAYGLGNTNTLSAVDTALSTTHFLTLTGLQPYRLYTFKIRTADGNGNMTVSTSKTFMTLR